MQPGDRKKFLETLNGLATIKPGKDLTPAALELWWAAMRDWPIEEFTAAASHLARSVEFMPSPFHFEQLRKAGKPTADEAWRIALKRCKDWRAPRETQDAVDEAAASIGGYRSIALADIEIALPHVQRRFLEAYSGIAAVSEVRAALPTIAPTPELPAPRSNSRDGRFAAIGAAAAAPRVSTEPKRLGDQSREQIASWLQKAGSR
jgi:hypothetical protein